MNDSKDRCSTCGYYDIMNGLCLLPNNGGMGVPKRGTDYCPSWIPYKKECNKDCKDLSYDDLCKGRCESCKDCDSGDNDIDDNYWPLYGANPFSSD